MDSTTACQQSEQILITIYNEAAKSHFLSHTYIYTYTHPDTHTVTLYNKWEAKTEKEKKGLYKKDMQKEGFVYDGCAFSSALAPSAPSWSAFSFRSSCLL